MAGGAVRGVRITASCPAAADMPARAAPALPVEAVTTTWAPICRARATTSALRAELRYYPPDVRLYLLHKAFVRMSETAGVKRTIRRDAVYCGVNTGLPGFSSADAQGNWSGFDVDFCRAIAAAIFNDPAKVKFIPLDAKERFPELQKRKVDVLARNSTWTMSRETDFALHFAGVSYYDGQGFMVPKARKIDSALELGGSKVCVQSETTTELNLDDYFRANNVKYQDFKFAKVDDVFKAYESGQCDTLTADVSQLYALRQKLAKPGDRIMILAPVVRGRKGEYRQELESYAHAGTLKPAAPASSPRPRSPPPPGARRWAPSP